MIQARNFVTSGVIVLKKTQSTTFGRFIEIRGNDLTFSETFDRNRGGEQTVALLDIKDIKKNL